MARINDCKYQIRFHPLTQSISEGKEACIEKPKCIIFDGRAFMQMLPILSKLAKVTSVAIVEQFRGYILRSVASIIPFHRYILPLTYIGRIV